MSLRDIVDSTYKNPCVRVYVDGLLRPDIFSVQVSKSVDSPISSATVVIANAAGIMPEAKVRIDIGYDNLYKIIFTGYVDTVNYNVDDKTYTLNCRDVLKKAVDLYLIQEVAFGIDTDTGLYYYSTASSAEGGTFTQHVYSSLSALHTNHPETVNNITNEGVRAEAVVQWLLVMAGFQEGTEIQVEPTNFFIGDLKPARFHLTSVFDAIIQIADLIGWAILADEAGVVRFKEKPKAAIYGPKWAYTLDKVYSLGTSISNVELRNYVEVLGHSGIRVVARSPSPYVGVSLYKGALVSSELIDTPDIARFFANRILSDLIDPKRRVSLEATGNPFLNPYDCVQITGTNLSDNLFMVESITTTIDENGSFSQITAVNYNEFRDFVPPPENLVVADFNYTDAFVLGDPTYTITFDGSPSYSINGSIVRYVWSAPNNNGQDSSSPTYTAVFSDAVLNSGVNVNLTVYDNTNASGTTSKQITLSGLQKSLDGKIKTRMLYGALTSVAVGSSDGGQTWNSVSAPVISVAASNFAPGNMYTTSGYAIFGGSDGTIYRTTDVCKSISAVFTGAGSAVNFVHVQETNSNNALAGTQGGRIYKSTNAGMTWTLLHTFSFPILEVRYGYTDTNYILVVGSGVNNVFVSMNGGVNWTRLTTQGVSANRESSGTSANYFALTSGIIALNGATWSTVPFTSGAPNVRAITIAIDNNSGIMAVDSTGQHWVFSGSQMVTTQYNPTNKTQYMIRDGEISNVVYYAVQSGIAKSVNRNQTIQPLYYPGLDGKMVAYGPMVIPKPVVEANVFAYTLDATWPQYPNWSGLINLTGQDPNGRAHRLFRRVNNSWRCDVLASLGNVQPKLQNRRVYFVSESSSIGRIDFSKTGYQTWYPYTNITANFEGFFTNRRNKDSSRRDEAFIRNTLSARDSTINYYDFFNRDNPNDVTLTASYTYDANPGSNTRFDFSTADYGMIPFGYKWGIFSNVIYGVIRYQGTSFTPQTLWTSPTNTYYTTPPNLISNKFAVIYNGVIVDIESGRVLTATGEWIGKPWAISFKNPAKLFYILTLPNGKFQVKSVLNYGFSQNVEVLFDSSDYAELNGYQFYTWFHSPNFNEDEDYIAISAYYISGGSPACRCVYSVDGGKNWTILTQDVNGYNNGIVFFVVDL